MISTRVLLSLLVAYSVSFVTAVPSAHQTPRSAFVAPNSRAPFAHRVASGRSVETALHGHVNSHRDGDELQSVVLPAYSSAQDCAQLCIDTPSCEAWSFAHPSCSSAFAEAFTCRLMSSKGSPFLAECSTSGTPLAGLLAPKYPRLPVSAVLPRGWLKTELALQQTGLAGHLHEFFDDVQDSEFIGGKHDTPNTNHERFLYWLNGEISMGHLNQDSAFEKVVMNFTDILIRNQSADGFLGPRQNFDPWPRMLSMYIFQQYHEIHPEDDRVIPAMFKYMNFLWKQYNTPSFDPSMYMWSWVRIHDMTTSIQWLSDHYGASMNQTQFLLDLNQIIYKESFDWNDWYMNKFPTGDQGHNWNYFGHGVNSGQSMKGAALQYRQSHDENDRRSSDQRLDKLNRYHGQASGIFSCDECLAGLNPSRGTELCTVVESMFSHEHVFSIFGDVSHFDRVEQLAFNAFPATQTADLGAHQYLQQGNQISANHIDNPIWGTDGGDSGIFGVAPNYACCTTNQPQGWPKLLASAYLLTQSETHTGILAALLGPSQLNIAVEDPTYGTNQITIVQDTDYPLKISPDVVFTVNSQFPFTLSIRVPGWATGSTLTFANGTTVAVLNGTVVEAPITPQTRHQAANQTVTLHLKYSFRSVRRFNNAISLYYGPILLALDFSYNMTVLQKYPLGFADYAYLPTDKWNYALQIDENNLDSSLKVMPMSISTTLPFDPLHPFFMVSAYAREIDWKADQHQAAAEPPMSPVTSTNPLVPITLIPFGSTMLRIAEIPTLAYSALVAIASTNS